MPEEEQEKPKEEVAPLDVAAPEAEQEKQKEQVAPKEGAVPEIGKFQPTHHQIPEKPGSPMPKDPPQDKPEPTL